MSRWPKQQKSVCIEWSEIPLLLHISPTKRASSNKHGTFLRAKGFLRRLRWSWNDLCGLIQGFSLCLPSLQSHQRQHNKDKPYKCPNCYRAYSDSASLQIHLSAHAIKNAKAYCCSMCGRAYTSVSEPKLFFRAFKHLSSVSLDWLMSVFDKMVTFDVFFS